MDRAVLHLPPAAAASLFPLRAGAGSTLVLGGTTAVRGPSRPDGAVPLTLSGGDIQTAVVSVLAAARRAAGKEEGEDTGWSYADARGAAQGPFALPRIAAWAASGFWNDSFLVTDVASGVRVPSGALFGRRRGNVAPVPPPDDSASDADMEDVALALAAARGAMDVDPESGVTAPGCGASVTALTSTAAALLIVDTSAALTRLSLLQRVLESGSGDLVAAIPSVSVSELDAINGRGGDLAPSARAALASLSGGGGPTALPHTAVETPADVAGCPSVDVPGAQSPPTADDRVLATALRWAARGRVRAPPLAVALVTLDRGLAARARAAGVAALAPRDLPRGREAVAALAAGGRGSGGANSHTAPLPPPPLTTPGSPPPSWQAMADALDDAVVEGLVPALAAALAAQFGPAWPELTPDPPPFTPDAALAAVKAIFASTLDDHYPRRDRARAARRAAETALRCARRARGGTPDAVAARAASLADLMADFPVVTGTASQEQAALAAARCVVAGVARAVEERVAAERGQR